MKVLPSKIILPNLAPFVLAIGVQRVIMLQVNENQCSSRCAKFGVLS